MRLVENAPCHEIVIQGEELNKDGKGLDAIPVPISTPGWDNAPYTTLSQYITKDPDTGVQNVGNYRGQVKARRRLGMNPSLELRPGIYNHWLKYKERGQKMPAAVVLGAPPFVSAQKIPEALDELEVARGCADHRGEGGDRRSDGAGRSQQRRNDVAMNTEIRRLKPKK